MAHGRFVVTLLALAALAGCGRGNEGELQVAFIEAPEDVFDEAAELTSGAQHVRAATHSGLVALNERGEVVPALADRWNVTDNGRSFIFRLREGTWPDGSDLTAEGARAALNRAIRAQRRTALGLDLEPIEEVRAMAGRVIEIRLSSPAPMFLQLLAQPELALARDSGGSGDMELAREGGTAVLTMKPPEERGLPQADDWDRHVRPIALRAVASADAIAMFDDGEVDLVLGGRIGALPLVNMGPLSRGTVQIDPALGLFGLRIRRAAGLLETDRGREAIAMALDRPALVAPFNIGGWTPTTRVVAPDLAGDPGRIVERWSLRTLDELRAEAASRVAAWSRENEAEEARLTLALEDGPGFDLLLRELARQLGTIGVRLERVAESEDADLVLVDRVARYAEPRWFLNQFNCSLRAGVCSAEADALVREAVLEEDPAARAALLADAEVALTLANVYIPFGSPLRFSLVRGWVEGFASNPWAFHPLPPLATISR